MFDLVKKEELLWCSLELDCSNERLTTSVEND